MYDDFASVYDTLMDDFDYDAWSAHYLTLIRTVTGELPRRAAECACGTGSLTVRLAQSGMAVTGVDLSAAMLRQAEKKARDYGVEVAFVRQDMKTDASQTGRCGAGHMRRRELSDNAERSCGVLRRHIKNLLPGGALCLNVPRWYERKTSWATLWRGLSEEITIWNRRNPDCFA
ncbi:MAG: class I SAM-dependent DNA methyltransferase [Christensenellales bacterium]